MKDGLQHFIDSIEDEHTLNVLNEDVVQYVMENRTKHKNDHKNLIKNNCLYNRINNHNPITIPALFDIRQRRKKKWVPLKAPNLLHLLISQKSPIKPFSKPLPKLIPS